MPTALVGWFANRGVIATPGYSIFDTPWAGVKASVGTPARSQNSADLGGGVLYNSANAQNDEWTNDHYLPAGTVKIAVLHNKGGTQAIYSLQWDGVEKGSIDGYAAAGSNNNYSEITGLASSAALVVVKIKAATRNASSTGWFMSIQTIAHVRTGA